MKPLQVLLSYLMKGNSIEQAAIETAKDAVKEYVSKEDREKFIEDIKTVLTALQVASAYVKGGDAVRVGKAKKICQRIIDEAGQL